MYAWSFTFFNLNINLFVYIILINIYTFVKKKKTDNSVGSIKYYFIYRTLKVSVFYIEFYAIAIGYIR